MPIISQFYGIVITMYYNETNGKHHILNIHVRYNKDKIISDGLGLIDYIFIPHYKSNNKVSHKMEKVVEMLRINKIKYKTFNDIETIIEDSDISN